MTQQSDKSLSAKQLAVLRNAFHQGSARASQALAKWLGRPSVVEMDSLELLPLAEATGLLGTSELPICFCAVQMTGLLTGELILAFDDASGLALADMLLEGSEPTGKWSELATSAVLETTNIVCCAYLNALSIRLQGEHDSVELLPTPPRFSREYAESLLEFALMGQAAAGDEAIVAKTRFEVDATPLHWTLLFLPDAESMLRLPELLEELDGTT